MIRETRTENGKVRGIPAADPRITAFKGIPFAAPPVGENRWRAPQPCKDWSGVLDCSRFGPIAMQPVPGLADNVYTREWHVDPDIPMSEDCLQLNVRTPARTAEEKLPVFVFFFGGGLQCGYPAEMEFDGERIARRGIVVVTVNYRVGVFGFLSLPELTGEAPEAPANFGLLDQQAGLRWVKRNIRFFGGDPERVTIGGQSAGGGSVLCQMANLGNKGLFSRALIMSALIVDPYSGKDISRPEPLWSAEEHGEVFLHMLGAGSLEEARRLDAGFVQKKYEEYCGKYPPMVTVKDGCFLKEDPIAQFLSGNALDISVMAGNTNDEFPNFLPAGADKKEFLRIARETFGEKSDEFLAIPEAMRADDHGRCGAVNGIGLTCKKVFLSLEQKTDKHFYYYCFEPGMPGWDHAGNFHSSDLWFFFETLSKSWRPFTGRYYDLAREMCNYLCSFIADGDPNSLDYGEDAPVWKPYTKEEPCEMYFTGYGSVPQYSRPTPFQAFLMDRIGENLQENEPSYPDLLRPVFQGGLVYRETFLCAEDERGEVSAPFLFTPSRILGVTSYDGRFHFESGRDYIVSGNRLVLPPDSRIAHTSWSRFYPEDEKAAVEDAKALPFVPDFGYVKTSDGRYVTLRALAHPEYTTKYQVCVTYETEETWNGPVPESGLDRLPKLREKLGENTREKPGETSGEKFGRLPMETSGERSGNGKELKVVLYGDSIACGFDCSGKYDQKPGQPTWGELLLMALRENWTQEVTFVNTSRGGADSLWAIQNADEKVCRYNPDLVILAWGMNDHCSREEYRKRMTDLISVIHGKCPDAEFLLVTTTLPNELLTTPPIYFCDRQDEYGIESVQPIAEEGLDGTGSGIAIADVQAVHREILKHKRYGDLTANWLNHPNDFLARIYAQTAAAVLGCDMGKLI